jgi:asparagine synthase (glutamine-hydrolysing)
MAATLAHRGPDGAGLWLDEPAGIALGHRRLAIVDPSEAGRQPMVSPDRRYVFMVNGELYNFLELREELAREGAEFRGSCDAEVMLQAVATWGVDRALDRFIGMFAFALWDANHRILHLARDRIGEKPLYYGQWNGTFVFASELKALRAHPGFSGNLDLDALAGFMRYSYIGGARSIYRDIRKLPPGTRLAITPGDHGNWPEPLPYWSLADLVGDADRHPFEGSDEEAVELLDDLLSQAVRLRRRADVPVGALLSGGIDSSTIVSLMASDTASAVKTFSIGTRDRTLDEAPAARAVANHLGCEHTELYIEEADALSIVPRLTDVFDEPFADASAIPVQLVSRLARTSVKAVLSGDGADEFLGGYARFAIAERLRQQTRWMPGPVRRAAGRLLSTFRNERMRAAGALLERNYPQSIYWHLLAQWKNPGPLADDLANYWASQEVEREPSLPANFPLELLYLDAVSILPGDYLVKMDRASMAEGLEVRLPFLDPAVVQWCLRLPACFRQRAGQSKWILRQVLRRYLPEHLIQTDKKGFVVPLAQWLRGPLREWAEDLLSQERLAESGVLAVEGIRQDWREHCSGRIDRNRRLWNVLMFQAWRRKQWQQ